MLENKHECNLPSQEHGDYNLGELGIPCMLTNDDEALKLATVEATKRINRSWARFMLVLRHTVQRDRRVFFINGKRITACINWLRDHIHEMKGYKHWEYDLKSYVDFMLEQQHERGFFYEITAAHDNVHVSSQMGSEDFLKKLEGTGLGLSRIELENDIEYLMVEACVNIYKATGDDEWIKKALPKLEKGIDFVTSDKDRFDKEHGLIKRVFTIDTWDFDPVRGGKDRKIYPDSRMSIMHGDNTGAICAMNSLSWLNRKFGNEEKANEWERRAKELKENLDKYCWNGDFYIHQLHLNHNGLDNLEEKRLSLSNAYALNRGVFTQEQGEKVIEEYLRRKDITDCFSEWFSINPPYEKFGNCEKNYYINGGIASFVAGELAKGAFEHGFEEYGWDILNRLRDLVIRDMGIHFLYDPQTGENQAGGPCGWSAAAIIDSIDRGLAGIKDADTKYRVLDFSPRWAVTGISEIRYNTGYEISDCFVETLFRMDDESMVLELTAPSEIVNCHIYMPKGKKASKILVNSKEVEFKNTKVRNSDYADFSFENNGERKIIHITF